MNNKDYETMEIENQPRLKSISLYLILTNNVYIISLLIVIKDYSALPEDLRHLGWLHKSC